VRVRQPCCVQPYSYSLVLCGAYTGYSYRQISTATGKFLGNFCALRAQANFRSNFEKSWPGPSDGDPPPIPRSKVQLHFLGGHRGGCREVASPWAYGMKGKLRAKSSRQESPRRCVQCVPFTGTILVYGLFLINFGVVWYWYMKSGIWFVLISAGGPRA
jgi:hypothetical protein